MPDNRTLAVRIGAVGGLILLTHSIDHEGALWPAFSVYPLAWLWTVALVFSFEFLVCFGLAWLVLRAVRGKG